MPSTRLEEILAATFGITAAILAVGGWILIRILRDRQQFRLMTAAFERGITSLPGTAPAWLSSMRQGVGALALGLGLTVGGAVLYRSANAIEQPPADTWGAGPIATGASTQEGNPSTMPSRMMPPPPDRMGPGGPGGHGGPGMGMRQGPPGLEALREGGSMQEPPRRSPAMQRWEKVQAQRFTGTIAATVGGILMLLGLVRIFFAFAEKKYVAELAAPGSAKA